MRGGPRELVRRVEREHDDRREREAIERLEQWRPAGLQSCLVPTTTHRHTLAFACLSIAREGQADRHDSAFAGHDLRAAESSVVVFHVI